MNLFKKKIVIGTLLASLSFAGILASTSSYAADVWWPEHEFNHMYNSSLAVSGALAGLAIVGVIAAAASANRDRECVYYTHNCYEHDGERECYSEKHYGEC